MLIKEIIGKREAFYTSFACADLSYCFPTIPSCFPNIGVATGTQDVLQIHSMLITHVASPGLPSISVAYAEKPSRELTPCVDEITMKDFEGIKINL